MGTVFRTVVSAPMTPVCQFWSCGWELQHTGGNLEAFNFIDGAGTKPGCAAGAGSQKRAASVMVRRVSVPFVSRQSSVVSRLTSTICHDLSPGDHLSFSARAVCRCRTRAQSSETSDPSDRGTICHRELAAAGSCQLAAGGCHGAAPLRQTAAIRFDGLSFT